MYNFIVYEFGAGTAQGPITSCKGQNIRSEAQGNQIKVDLNSICHHHYSLGNLEEKNSISPR